MGGPRKGFPAMNHRIMQLFSKYKTHPRTGRGSWYGVRYVWRPAGPPAVCFRQTPPPLARGPPSSVTPNPRAGRPGSPTPSEHLEVVGAKPPRSSPIRPPPGGLGAGWEVFAAPWRCPGHQTHETAMGWAGNPLGFEVMCLGESGGCMLCTVVHHPPSGRSMAGLEQPFFTFSEGGPRESAGRFFLQRDWLHLLNSAPKRVLSWQVFEQQISAC
jgi:hypothetical protein